MTSDPTDAEREALASCPFCGSDAYPASSGLTNWIECRHCHASSGSGSNASALWNRRSPASLLRAWEMGRDAAADECDEVAVENHWAFAPERHELVEVAAARVRSLPPPHDLMQRAGDAQEAEDFDPTSSDQWHAGCDYAITQLAAVLGIEPSSFSWDAATEELEGDVRAVIGNALEAGLGEDWQDLRASSGERRAPASGRPENEL